MEAVAIKLLLLEEEKKEGKKKLKVLYEYEYYNPNTLSLFTPPSGTSVNFTVSMR